MIVGQVCLATWSEMINLGSAQYRPENQHLQPHAERDKETMRDENWRK